MAKKEANVLACARVLRAIIITLYKCALIQFGNETIYKEHCAFWMPIYIYAFTVYKMHCARRRAWFSIFARRVNSGNGQINFVVFSIECARSSTRGRHFVCVWAQLFGSYALRWFIFSTLCFRQNPFVLYLCFALLANARTMQIYRYWVYALCSINLAGRRG